ncbi:MAG: iron-sulfur cluster assembly scaffold protein [Gemmatimonadaceae bacterium]
MTTYRAIVLEHFRHPRNCGPLADANADAEGANPLCGDRIRIRLKVENGVIADAKFTADACILCIASASVLTERLRGLALTDAALVDAAAIHEALEGTPPPAREKCITLPLDTARRAVRAFRDADLESSNNGSA